MLASKLRPSIGLYPSFSCAPKALDPVLDLALNVFLASLATSALASGLYALGPGVCDLTTASCGSFLAGDLESKPREPAPGEADAATLLILICFVLDECAMEPVWWLLYEPGPVIDSVAVCCTDEMSMPPKEWSRPVLEIRFDFMLAPGNAL